jgi:hypothetical protein
MSASSASASSSSSSSPLSLVAGTWKRLFEEEPIGNVDGADTTTLVLWTQSRDSGIYVDLRLPLNSPGRRSPVDAVEARNNKAAADGNDIFRPRPSALAATGFSKQAKTIILKEQDSARLLDILLQQKSFAGMLTVRAGDATATPGLALQRDAILASLANAAAANKNTLVEPADAATSSLSGTSSTIPLCTCFWRRDLDYQPPSLDLDIGVCVSSNEPSNTDADVMRETGANGSYAEGWQRLPRTTHGPFMALELQSENGLPFGARKGYWVRAGRCFAYAVGRPTRGEFAKQLSCVEHCDSIQKDCVGKSLAEAVESLYATTGGSSASDGSATTDKILDMLGSYVGLAGEIDDNNSQWRIQHSTNPELVGCLLVSHSKNDDPALCCSQLHCIPAPSDGESSSSSSSPDSSWSEVEQVIVQEGGVLVKRRWKVVELSGCSLPTS